MHEWGLAVDLIAKIEAEGRKRNASRITAVKLKIGSLSGVSIEAFEFAFSSTDTGTMIAENALSIEPIEARSRCNACGAEFADRDGCEWCAACGSADKTRLCGNEMSVESFTMEENESAEERLEE